MRRGFAVLLMLCFLPVASVGLAAITTNDYARADEREEWLRHPALGDPSCDTFTRVGGPILSGMPGLEWPVNGTLLADPRDGAWYLFGARYPKDYVFQPPPNNRRCAVFRSRDHGANWESLGQTWSEVDFRFNGVILPSPNSPDVAVCAADGRYHMVYCWSTASNNWTTLFNPPPTGTGPDSGVGYAWAESPAGPWHRSPEPLFRNSQVSRAPLLGKYRRIYASTLLRRKHDWLLLSAMDSKPIISWALVGATASRPEGPYSKPVPLMHTEDGRYIPEVLEFFPAFTHAGTAYAPATALGPNHHFQALFAADLEQAHRPEAWRLAQEGAYWHSEDAPAEAGGLFGQTPGGMVTDGQLVAVFPTRDRASIGHLSLATRPWNQPFHDGLVLSGHEVPAPAPLRWNYDAFHLEAHLSSRGTNALLWAWTPAVGRLGIPGWGLHAQCLRRYQGVEIDGQSWRVVVVDAQGQRQMMGTGSRQPGAVDLSVDRTDTGATTLTIAGERIWQGDLPAGAGALGLVAANWSHLKIERLAVSGERSPATAWYVAEDAFYGAGGTPAEWTLRNDPGFHFGIGLAHVGAGGRVKWNVRASSLTLWSPGGPDESAFAVELDGRRVATIKAQSGSKMASAPVWRSGPIPYGPHTVVLRSVSGPLVVDVLEAVVR